MADWVVRAQGLEKLFDDKQGRTLALNQVDFQAAAGKMTALIGPDGAGKTTTLAAAVRTLVLYRGKLKVLGLMQCSKHQKFKRESIICPKKFGLYEDLTVQENLDLYADLFGVEGEKRRQRFAKLLSMTGLEAFTGRLAVGTCPGHETEAGSCLHLVRSPELLLWMSFTVGWTPVPAGTLGNHQTAGPGRTPQCYCMYGLYERGRHV